MIVKYVGLTAQAAEIVEHFRSRPDQAEWEIIVEALQPRLNVHSSAAGYELGQGVRLNIGEYLYLFLNEQAKRARKQDGIAEVRKDGIYVEGRKIEPSRGSSLQPAMQIFQRRAGRLVSLSAWRQWHVLRENRFVSLVELKDPALARRRGAPVDVEKFLAGLDLDSD